MDNEFGEDLALVHHAGHLLQGTWLEGYVIVWSLRPLERVGTIGCDEREMWGLAYARDRGCFYTSHGDESVIVVRNDSMEASGRLTVSDRGSRVGQINALSYHDGLIWANIYPSTDLAIIDASDGAVLCTVDCAALVPNGVLSEEDVFNGVAHLPGGREVLVTGKHWAKMYTVDANELLRAAL
jgi:glutamine cyclotransferase